MVTAIVLINCERTQINQVAETLANVKGISEVFSVAGRYDLVAILRIPNNDALANVVTNHLRLVSGITATETLIAFKAFSRHDLEAMFEIGFEE
jgi:DNA-binding Lrp family transcriptional regulator